MADHAAANEDIWPSQNDVAQTVGNGKKLLENQWALLLAAVLGSNNFIISGFALPASSGTLNINVPLGSAIIAGRYISIPGATTITAAASTTNHVFLKLVRDGASLVTGAVFEVNTTGTPPADSHKIGTLVASGSAITSTTDTRVLTTHVSQNLLVKPCVGTPELKTATGSAAPANGVISDIVLNDYSFFPNIQLGTISSPGTACFVRTHSGNNADTVGRLSYDAAANAGGSGNVRWRYITASDDPTIWVATDPSTGQIMASWASDDPTPGDVPGIEVPGMVSVKLKAQQLEHLSALSDRARDASDLIRETRRKMQHQAYRALQLHAGDDAPSRWLMDHCELDIATGLLRMKE